MTVVFKSPQYAPVVPLHLLEDLESEGMLGNYFLLLAHDVVENEDAYFTFFHGRSDAFVILDNSVVELGQPADVGMMSAAVQVLHPDIVVLPDVEEDAAATMERMVHAAGEWRQHGLGGFMAVPQGKTQVEFNQCAVFIENQIPGVEMWGIPRNCVKNMGSRQPLVRMLNGLNPFRPIHLLGFSNDLQDDINSLCIPLSNVIGIDSASPFVLGHQQSRVDRIEFWEHPGRGDFWKEVEGLNDHMVHNLELINNAIDTRYASSQAQVNGIRPGAQG